MTESMIKYQTTFEATENLPMIIAIGHGENADLVASFKDGGIDVALEGYTARAIYQPSSKWGTDDWYECPCEIVDDTVIAHWGNTYDNGDDAVKLFMHLVKNGKLAYPAIYQIKLFASPGFSPSAIEPIPETIDFAQYQLENAPWLLPNDVAVNVKEFVKWNPRPDEYLGQTIVIKTHDDDQSIPEGYVEPYQDEGGSLGERKLIGNQSTLTWTAGVDCALNITATKEVLSSAYYIGNQTAKLIQPYGEYLTEEDIELSTVYSSNPRFTEWVPVNYIFTVGWKENLNHWIFNFNGTEVGDSTGEWANPNATSLSFNYNGIQLKANRNRLDVGYVLGSQTDKPLQPMGDYATNTKVDEINSDLEYIASKIPYQIRNISVPQTPNVQVTVNAENREVVGVQCGNGTTPVIDINLPVQIEGQAIEFIVDIDNQTANNIRTVINWSTNWLLVLDDGDLLSTYNYTTAGKITRLIFKQIGVPGISKPRLHLSRKLLSNA